MLEQQQRMQLNLQAKEEISQRVQINKSMNANRVKQDALDTKVDKHAHREQWMHQKNLKLQEAKQLNQMINY